MYGGSRTGKQGAKDWSPAGNAAGPGKNLAQKNGSKGARTLGKMPFFLINTVFL